MRNVGLILALLGLIFASDCSASARDKLQPKESKNSCKLISKKSAISKAQSQTGGKVVNIKLDKKDDRSVYRVRVLVGEKRIKNLTIKACR